MQPGAKTPAELRRFGLTVGSVFLVIAGISRWRGHVWPPTILGTLGALLVVPGLVFPSVLRPIERGWMAFAEVLAWVNTRIILGLLYYLLITPVGWVLRRFRDPMDRRLDDGRVSDWIPRQAAAADIERYRQQF